MISPILFIFRESTKLWIQLTVQRQEDVFPERSGGTFPRSQSFHSFLRTSTAIDRSILLCTCGRRRQSASREFCSRASNRKIIATSRDFDSKANLRALGSMCKTTPELLSRFSKK